MGAGGGRGQLAQRPTSSARLPRLGQPARRGGCSAAYGHGSMGGLAAGRQPRAGAAWASYGATRDAAERGAGQRTRRDWTASTTRPGAGLRAFTSGPRPNQLALPWGQWPGRPSGGWLPAHHGDGSESLGRVVRHSNRTRRATRPVGGAGLCAGCHTTRGVTGSQGSATAASKATPPFEGGGGGADNPLQPLLSPPRVARVQQRASIRRTALSTSAATDNGAWPGGPGRAGAARSPTSRRHT
jgi:hypothetical protein